MELDHSNIALSKTAATTTKAKETKPAWPWWLIPIGLVGGWIGRGYWPAFRLKLFG
jgi:hypothetical protein